MKKLIYLFCLAVFFLWISVCFMDMIETEDALAAIRLQQQVVTYYGLSSDTKPTMSAGQTGSTFIETDTGLIYVYTGSAWATLKTSTTYIDTITAAGQGRTFATLGYTDLVTTISSTTSGESNYTVMAKASGNISGGWGNLMSGSKTVDWKFNKASGDSSDIYINTNIALFDSIKIYGYTVADTLYGIHRLVNKYK